MPGPPDRPLFPEGALLMAGSALSFSVMSLLVKLASETLPSNEVVFARSLLTLVFSYVHLRWLGIPPFGTDLRLLGLRGVLGAGALYCYYASLHLLPLAEAVVIQYLNPTIAALLAAVFIGERARPGVLVASALSLVGVVLCARPAALFGSSEALDPTSVGIAVLGAVFSAGAYVTVRRVAQSEHPLVVVFWFPLVALPLTLPLMWTEGEMPTPTEALILLGVGISTQVGQVWMTRSLVHLQVATGTAISYLQVLFATFWGLAVFAEVPSSWTLLGATLILLGSLGAAHRGRQPETGERVPA